MGRFLTFLTLDSLLDKGKTVLSTSCSLDKIQSDLCTMLSIHAQGSKIEIILIISGGIERGSNMIWYQIYYKLFLKLNPEFHAYKDYHLSCIPKQNLLINSQ